MSFRSRSRTTQPLPSRRRSLSSSRVPSSGSYNYNGTSYHNGSTNGGYMTSNSRPLSTGYYSNNANLNSSSPYYQNPYNSAYSSRENLYGGSSSLVRNGGANSYYTNALNGYDGSRYNSNPYSSDLYISPYQSYDKGITTASLSINMGPSAASYKGSNSYLNKNASLSTPSRSLSKSKALSASNSSLNSYPSTSNSNTPNVAAMAAIVSRSNSLREQERKSRTRSRSRTAAQRSLSASSEKSEGYESGSETRPSRSRVGSTSSTVSVSTSTSATDDKKTRDKSENNGDNIDYKALWEAVKLENEKLKQQLKKKDEEVVQTRATIERITNAQLDVYKAENLRLKEENGALIRVISKLSK